MTVCNTCFLSVDIATEQCGDCDERRFSKKRIYFWTHLAVLAGLAAAVITASSELHIGLLTAVVAYAFVARMLRSTEALTR